MTELAVRNDDDVITGEIVTGDAAPVQPQDIRVQVVNIISVARTVATHRHTRRAVRHASYIGLGAYATGRKLTDSRTTARYNRMIRAAELSGQHQAALEWDQQKLAFLQQRHQRRMERRESALRIAKASPYIAGGSVAVLLLVGGAIAYGTHDAANIILPVKLVAEAVAGIAFVISVAWGPLVLAAPWIAVAALWHAGLRYARTSAAPAWLQTAAAADKDLQIDETTIAKALDALRIPQIRDYLKAGTPLQFLVTARQEGRGTYAQLRLPAGVTAERIARRRGDLATGLYRQAKEVWPSTGSEAGILDLWVADKGALAEGAGPYPLLDEGMTDVFKGVPFGRTLKGDPMTAPLMERNTLVGGMPGQGKSSGARVIMAGAALDPTAELRIAIPDTNFDFEALKPRCSVYIMGAETERIEEIRNELLRLHAEVQERGELLVRYQVPAVTRELASAGVGLHPVFFLLEEAHVAITHPEYGKEISGLLVDIVRLGRKRAIHVIVSTQAPTKDSMPRDVTRNCSNGIAYAVGDHVANDALLGQGAYRGGHRATELIPGTDRGIAVVKGFTGERSEMAQCYFIDVKDVPAIMDRALAEIARHGLAVPGTGVRRAIEARDLLADLDEVTRDALDRVRLADLPGMLRKLAPAWHPYKSLTGTELRQQFEAAGVRVTNSKNVPQLDPADLRKVLADRG